MKTPWLYGERIGRSDVVAAARVLRFYGRQLAFALRTRYQRGYRASGLLAMVLLGAVCGIGLGASSFSYHVIGRKCPGGRLVSRRIRRRSVEGSAYPTLRAICSTGSRVVSSRNRAVSSLIRCTN